MGRRKKIGNGLVGRTVAAVFRVSHTVPAVGFLIAALLGVAWWKLRAEASAVLGWAAVIVWVLAIFFAVVAGIGFLLILLERSRARRRDRAG